MRPPHDKHPNRSSHLKCLFAAMPVKFNFPPWVYSSNRDIFLGDFLHLLHLASIPSKVIFNLKSISRQQIADKNCLHGEYLIRSEGTKALLSFSKSVFKYVSLISLWKYIATNRIQSHTEIHPQSTVSL